MTPEQQARELIDQQLRLAGWPVVPRDEVLPNAPAQAVCEEQMQNQHRADYTLLLYGHACAVIEAKSLAVNLLAPAVKAQAEGYTTLLNPQFPAVARPLPLVFLANGQRILFRDLRTDVDYIPLQCFLSPSQVLERCPELNEYVAQVMGKSFMRLPELEQGVLRTCQFEAINNLETALQQGKRRAYMVMATGSGKTITARTALLRLFQHSNVRRVLYLTDRTNLGTDALTTFRNLEVEGKFPFKEQLHAAQLTSAEQLTSSFTGVHFATIQRVSAIMKGQELNLAKDQDLVVETPDEDLVAWSDSLMETELPEEVPADSCIPCDYYDLIVIDECHRSIYNKWRKFLDYFGQHAILLGLTATPIPETDRFFQGCCLINYSLEQSIADGVNVGMMVYRVMTERSVYGGAVNPGERMEVTSNYTGESKDTQAQVSAEFTARAINRSVALPQQVETIIVAFRDAVFTKLFPERKCDFNLIPKTLVFAQNQRHARMIVQTFRKVFGRSDSDYFVVQVTYSEPNCELLINKFRYDQECRIAVTVGMLSTGANFPAVEILLFMAYVRSEVLYTQMKGRGVRSISDALLQEVTPNALHKDYCVLFDAVGVTESEKAMPSLNVGESVLSLERLLELLSRGVVSNDNLLLLATRLNNLALRGDQNELLALKRLAPKLDLQGLALDICHACERGLPPYQSSSAPNLERKSLIAVLMEDLPARKKLLEISKGYFRVLPQQQDQVIYEGFTFKEAEHQVEGFESRLSKLALEEPIFAQLKRNEADAELFTASNLKLMKANLEQSFASFNVQRLWRSYGLLLQDQGGRTVVPLTAEDEVALTNIYQLTRFGFHNSQELISLHNSARFAQRFNLWCGQAQNSLPMDPAMRELYRLLAQTIVRSGVITGIKALRKIDSEIFDNMRDLLGINDSDRAIHSLNRFLLAA